MIPGFIVQSDLTARSVLGRGIIVHSVAPAQTLPPDKPDRGVPG